MSLLNPLTTADSPTQSVAFTGTAGTVYARPINDAP